MTAVEASGRGDGWFPGSAGHGRGYRFTDPDGHRMTVYYESRYHEPAGNEIPTLKNQPQRMSTHGVGVRRLDHVNVWCRDIDENSGYMVETLGFRISEQVVGDDGRLVGCGSTSRRSRTTSRTGASTPRASAVASTMSPSRSTPAST